MTQAEKSTAFLHIIIFQPQSVKEPLFPHWFVGMQTWVPSSSGDDGITPSTHSGRMCGVIIFSVGWTLTGMFWIPGSSLLSLQSRRGHRSAGVFMLAL